MEELQLRSRNTSHVIVVDVEQPADETTTKRNKSSMKESFMKFFSDWYLSLKEAREKKTTLTEKIIWLLMFISCFTYCGFLIWKSYTKWMKSPAIVWLTDNDGFNRINEIPFPAITICPERKIRSKVFDFGHYYEVYNNESESLNLTEQELYMTEDMSLICNYDHILRQGRNFSLGNETVINIMKASVRLTEVIKKCNWQGEQRICSNIFTPILTEEGICFTFNTIGPEDLFRLENMHTDYKYMAQLNRTRNQGWTMEDGYPDYEQTFPERGSGAGAKAGLELKLTELEEHLDNFCKGRLSGFKILLHNPCDLPRPSQQYIRIPTYADVTLSFIASMEMTSEGLEVFSPTGRQCYFAEERTLTYFRQYTQSNCEFECLTNYTYARCGCVHFSMPHGPNMAICNVGSTDCINKAETELATFDIDDEQRGNVTIEQAFYIAIECNCLPACNSIAYETETTLSVLHDEDRHTFRLNWRDFDLETYKVSNIMLFFKKSQFELWIRSELYGTSDILASCGGLLGLFMGFSVINIIEILYFCILSICRRHKTAEKHPDEEELEHSKDKY